MSKILRYTIPAAILLAVIATPRQATTQAEPPVIEVTLSLTDLPAPVVNVTVPEQPAPVVNVEAPAPTEQAPPVVNIEVPEFPAIPAPVVNVESAPAPEPEIIYQDREVERIVEIPSCLDYEQLPYFDLANALTVAFPGEPWSLSGSHYPGLVWHGEGEKPDMTAIIGGWLSHLETEC